jgi:hypothetical protein
MHTGRLARVAAALGVASALVACDSILGHLTDCVSGGEDGGTAPGGWCASQTGPIFCEDFHEYCPSDAGAALSGVWSVYANNGTLAVSQGGLVVTAQPPAKQSAYVDISKSFGPPPSGTTRLRLGFTLAIGDVGAIDPLAAAGLAAIATGGALTTSDITGGAYAALAIGNGPSGFELDAVWIAPGPGQNPAFMASMVGAVPMTGKALAYVLEVENLTTGACVQVYQNGAPALASCLPLPSAFNPADGVSIGVGDYAGGVGHNGSIDLTFSEITFSED